ncbi:MAG: DUF924 domain-containing protein [Rhodobacteraceae bacterium]|nr:DUF924 domain-containing protein [Paracoccaceae bacterium]
MVTPEHVLSFWLDEIGPKDWYNSSPELDREIASRFEAAWDEIMEGGNGLWLTYPSGVLAYLLVTDQFSRNMFRDTAKAFASDHVAHAAAVGAISKDWDLKISEPARQFFYLPLEHSENQCDQDRAVRLFAARMPESGSNLLHAQAHRMIIRKFGRFPFRNTALGRKTTSPEDQFLAAGGYGEIVRNLQAAS